MGQRDDEQPHSYRAPHYHERRPGCDWKTAGKCPRATVIIGGLSVLVALRYRVNVSQLKSPYFGYQNVFTTAVSITAAIGICSVEARPFATSHKVALAIE
jgi:hypothetical protein